MIARILFSVLRGSRAKTLSGNSLREVSINPSVHFESQKTIIAEDVLSAGEKQKVLVAWEEDALRLSVGTEEGVADRELLPVVLCTQTHQSALR